MTHVVERLLHGGAVERDVFVSGLTSGGAVDNLTRLNAAAGLLGDQGTIFISSAGEFLISDSWIIDADVVGLRMASDTHIFTNGPTVSGGAVVFSGHGNIGSTSVPNRESATMRGGKVSARGGTLVEGESGENAVGFNRFRSVHVSNVEVPEANNKAFTAQWLGDGCAVSFSDLTVGRVGYRGVAIEQQGGVVRADVRRVTVESAGREAVQLSVTSAFVEDIDVQSSHTTGATTSGTVAVYGSDLADVTVERVTVGDSGHGKGVVVSSATGSVHVADVTQAAGSGPGLDLYNCTGSVVYARIASPNAPPVTHTGTTPPPASTA